MTDASQILTKSGAVLVLGDPGTGKSALLSSLIRDLSHSCLEDRDTAKLPVYVPLQQLTPYLPKLDNREIRPDEALSSLTSWFKDFELLPLGMFDSDQMLLSLAQSPNNGLVILLDGLDEISIDHITRVESFIIGLTQFMSTAPGKNLIVVASRRQALDFTPRLLDGSSGNMLAVELRPFSPAAIYSFLLRWPYKPGHHPASEARRIFSQLRLNPTLLDTCSNPLALALYVNHDLRLQELGQSYGGPQPDTRAAFFVDIVDYLLVRRRSDQLGLTAPTRPVRQYRNNMFVAVAEEHIKSNEDFNHISDSIMLKYASGLAREGQTPEQALSDLAKDTGIISRDPDGSWRFIHRSFLDYFLANSIATVSRAKDLQHLFSIMKSSPLRYLEGFYLACGLMASRNTPYLETVLWQLGHNTFVGKYYPRATLEAQAYFLPGFAERIKFYCDLWKRDKDRDEVDLFRDLVAVLVDYEHSCKALGRKPEITALGEFQTDLENEGTSVLQAARLDVDLAMRIAKTDSMAKILVESATEDAIVALYDPDISERLAQSEVERDPRLAALLCETALRSPLFAASLAQSKENGDSAGTRPPSWRKEPWADAWPIRGTRFAAVLSTALAFVRTSPTSGSSGFPHLTVLAHTRPIRRLRYELMFGDWRMSLLLVSIFIIMIFPFWLIGFSVPALAAVSLPIALLILLSFRIAFLRGVITPRSQRMLNLQPLESESATLPDKHVRLVSGDRRSLKRWLLRRPVSTDGMVAAVYIRQVPLVWRRFCPALGDSRMPRAGCAAVQHFYTEDVRRLVGS